MRRLLFWFFLWSGGFLILLGLHLTTGGPYTAAAQDFSEAGYVGADECGSCHRAIVRNHAESPHTLALQEVSRRQPEILADFDAGDALRMVQFPEEDEARPFTADDIELVIGAGRHIQAYLYERDRNDYVVLPAVWNVVEETWEPYSLAESWPDAAYDFGPNCAGCHTTGLDVERFRWEDNGVQCEACHGPASVHVDLARDYGRNPDDEELAEIRAAIYTGADSQVCGQCHSQGHAPETNLPYPVDYRPGQPLLDEAVFQLVEPGDPAHYWPSGHAKQKYMQFNEWVTSAHATALTSLQESDYDKSETCLTCHSGDYRFTQARIALHEEGDREGAPPEPLTVETAQFGVTCVTCHDPHSDDEELPSLLVSEPYSLCTGCHVQPAELNFIHHPTQEMYEGLTLVEHVEGVPGVHFTAEDGPNCLTCHASEVPVDFTTRASHTLHPILPGAVEGVAELTDTCSACHTEAVTPAGLQQLVEDIRSTTQSRLAAAQAALGADSPEWVRAALSFVEGDGSLGLHNVRYSDALLGAAEAELGLSTGGVMEVDVRALLNVPPPAESLPAAQAAAQAGVQAGGLTLPSIILLGISGLTLLVSAYVFFVRGDD